MTHALPSGPGRTEGSICHALMKLITITPIPSFSTLGQPIGRIGPPDDGRAVVEYLTFGSSFIAEPPHSWNDSAVNRPPRRPGLCLQLA
jgi:hypothetical protein